MGRQGGKDTPRPAPRHRNERLHHERRGGASFARVRGVEEALRHLFHPSNDGVDAFPPAAAAAGGAVSSSSIVGMAPFDMGRFAIPSAMAQYRRDGDGSSAGKIDGVQGGDGTFSLCDRIAYAFG